MPEHCQPGQCQRPAKCANCSGDHSANSMGEREKSLIIKCENNLSFPEARKQFEQFYQARTYASAVKPGTCNKSTQTEDKCTQTDDSITEYTKEKKHQHKHKIPRKENHKKKYFLFALKPATLEMMRKEEEKKIKRNSKNNKKKKDDINITKKKNNMRSKRNQYYFRRIHFLCLKRTMREMTWMMLLWFSQILPPVITSLKAHFHDLYYN